MSIERSSSTGSGQTRQGEPETLAVRRHSVISFATRCDTEGGCSGAPPAPRPAGRVRSQSRHARGAAAPPVLFASLAPLRVRADGCRSEPPGGKGRAGLSAPALPLAFPRRVRQAPPPMGTRPARSGALADPWGCHGQSARTRFAHTPAERASFSCQLIV